MRQEVLHCLGLGRGSLELLEFKEGRTIELKSLPLGAIAVAGRSGLSLIEPIPTKTTKKLKKEVHECLDQQAGVFKNSNLHLVGCGGTLVFSASDYRTISPAQISWANLLFRRK